MANGPIDGIGQPTIFQVNIRFSIENSKCQIGFKLRDLALNDNTPESVATAVDPWITNNFRTMLSTTDPIEAVDVVQLRSEEAFQRLYVGVFGNLDISAANKLPSFMAVNVALKTPLRKRYGQGRMFLPLRDANLTDGDFLNAAGIASYEGSLTALMTLFSGSVLTHDLALVNAHETIAARPATTQRPARDAIPPHWYDVTVVKVNRTVTSVRSRKLGIGA